MLALMGYTRTSGGTRGVASCVLDWAVDRQLLDIDKPEAREAHLRLIEGNFNVLASRTSALVGSAYFI